MTEEEKIDAGILFYPEEKSLVAIKSKAHNLNIDYNATHEDEVEKRKKIINEIIGHLGEGSVFQGPIYFHYGKHTTVGKGVFANFNFTVQDDAKVTIGDDCYFGPNVTIVTPMHPMIANERKAMKTANGEEKLLCYAKPVKIGKSCWFGANVTVCPGVIVGDNCVIGAGSVVTKDIPPNTFAAGVPCKVIREISEEDSMKNKPEILADNEII